MNPQVTKSLTVIEALFQSQMVDMRKLSPTELQNVYHAADYESKNPVGSMHQVAAQFTAKCAEALLEVRQEEAMARVSNR